MVKKIGKVKFPTSANAPLPAAVRDSAQQIWQAGLGAFTRAQAEGTKAFEALVKEGVSMQRKTTAAAEEKINEATSKVTHMASDISGKASGQWDKLESIFEERVARALNKLGVPSAKDVNALIERIDTLSKAVHKLSAKAPAAPAKRAQTAAKTAAKSVKKPAAKKSAAAKKVPAKAAKSKAA